MKPRYFWPLSITLAFASLPAQAEEAAGMPQMDPTWIASQLFWLFLTFGIFYIVVSRSIVPNVKRVLDKRSTTLSSDILDAEKMGREAEEARAHFEKAQADARSKASAMISEVQTSANASLAAEQAKLDEKLKVQMASADADIAAKRKAAEAEIAPAAAALAAEITGKLLGEKQDASRLAKHIATS